MAHYSVLAWLCTGAILTGQALVVYAIFRYITLGRPRVNPFRHGWEYLAQRNKTNNGPKLLDVTSVVIGSASYSNSMQVAFGETDVFLQKYFAAHYFLRLPYQDFTVVAPPQRVTILGFPLTTAGIFSVAGVEISFAKPQATELLARLKNFRNA